MFLVAQFIGIGVVYKSVDSIATLEGGKTVFKNALGEQPDLAPTQNGIMILFAILLGTGVMLLIIKYNLIWVWKIWFLFAVTIALFVAFKVLIIPIIAFGLALVLGLWKLFRPNFYIQTITELFIYGGLAAIFVPMLNLLTVSVLLVLISVYDYWAVNKSKHMVKLAKSQTKAGMFAGLLVPYKISKPSLRKKTGKKVKVRTAMLGGGDVGFPIIFAGVVLAEMGLLQALVIPFFALGGLGYLFWKSEQKKFYPAMPFISVGCFIGLAVVYLIGFL
jgi:presenilin-like A22 family membrane protease